MTIENWDVNDTAIEYRGYKHEEDLSFSLPFSSS